VVLPPARTAPTAPSPPTAENGLAYPGLARLAGRMPAKTVRAERLDFHDADAVDACYQVYLAAQRADDPAGSWMSPATFRGWLTVGWSGDPREVWTARDGDEVTGWYRLETPERENRTRAGLDLVVHPARRRRGTGGALLRHATERAAARGRTQLDCSAWVGSAGEALARSAGASPSLTDVRRVQELADLPPDRVAKLREQAAKAAAGYSLTSWDGPVPGPYLEDMAKLMEAMADAPHSPGTERRRWDAERVRTDLNAIFPELGNRAWTIVARHDATGALAALTQVWLDPDVADWAFQGLTVVVREHRGHRLGLLVKTAMLEHLARAEPGLKRLETWNAGSNAHMIAVNDALGYRVVGPPLTRWRLDLTAR
jgi:GNAT superfamily N-acetyltransferase